MMTQTTIDQFYKVTSGKKKSGNAKDTIEKLSRKNPVIAKIQKGGSLENIKTTFLYDKSKKNLNKINEKQRNNTIQNNTSCNEASCSTKINTNNSPIKIMEANIVSSNFTSPVRSQQCIPQSHSGSKFTPKSSSPIKNALEKSQKYVKLARKKLFKDRTEELISMTIDNLNLAKQGAIADNNIELEKIYSSRKFKYKYSRTDTTTSTKYEINDVIVPVDTYSLHFFLVVITVFSNPINCGYFNEHELDLIFSLLILSRDAQALFIRMLKRKHIWHRINSIKYTEIANDLKPIFDELISRSIFKSNMDEEDISVLLNLLQVDEIRKLCQELKISSTGKKNGMQSILKFCSKTKKSLFPGISSPAMKLRASLDKLLGGCVLLHNTVKELVDRIITLLIPNRDPTETIADVFLMILRVETNQMKFPEIVISDFPIFSSKKHLLDYIEAKSTLSNILSAIEKKQWETVRNFGFLAAQRLPLHLEMEIYGLKDSILPQHIRHFLPGYVWLKILSKSIDSFKKTKETMPQAIEFLHMLIRQDCYMRDKKGQWYAELIKIEMYHRKNFDIAVELLSNAVSCNSLTKVDKLDLLNRAEMLIKRKGISQYTKDTIKQILDGALNQVRQTSQMNSIIIEGTLCRNITQGKSTWLISKFMDKEVYGTVENLALHHYKCKGYPKGIHCEGAFPVMLFGTLFWDEIYNMDVSGAYVSLYQDAPMDLFSLEFYENRKEKLDTKLQIIRKFDSETMSRHLKHEFDLHYEYRSVLNMQGSIFDDSSNLQEVALCLGVEAIVGICERLIHNFSLWKAGFPDLIVWNACIKKYKIVEVKGPGDSLSTKQKLWLEYLNQLGLNTEVCYCESNIDHNRRKRKHEEVIT